MVPRPTMEKELKTEEKELTDDINNLVKKVYTIIYFLLIHMPHRSFIV